MVLTHVYSDFFCSAVVGTAAQQLLSRVHEVPTAPFTGCYLAVVFASYLYFICTLQTGPLAGLWRLLAINLGFWLPLTLLTIIRRLWFHPLKEFPGVRLAAVTKLYEFNRNVKGRYAADLRRLHREHGDFIRIAPNELSVCNVEAISKIHGKKEPTTRGPWYAVGKLNEGSDSLMSVRDEATHTAWRRIWEKGFTSARVAEYSPRVEHHVAKMISILHRHNGREISCTPVIDSMAFDIMADLAFGKDANTQDGGDRTYLDFMHHYTAALGTVGSLRNLCELVPFLPKDKGLRIFIGEAWKWLNERQKIGKSRQDFFTHLLGEDDETGTRFTQKQLFANVQLVSVAGTDTTAGTLSSALRFLAIDRERQEKLREEIDSHFGHISEINIENTKALPYLNGVIKEALRLWPAVPSGLHAITGPKGTTIAGRYIPGKVAVRVPTLALHTDERYFSAARDFIPERWTAERPELVKDKRAFIPFSHGANMCLGQVLAQNEIRVAMAKILKDFTIELGETYDDDAFNAGWRDQFTAMLGPLPLRFVPRQKA